MFKTLKLFEIKKLIVDDVTFLFLEFSKIQRINILFQLFCRQFPITVKQDLKKLFLNFLLKISLGALNYIDLRNYIQLINNPEI